MSEGHLINAELWSITDLHRWGQTFPSQSVICPFVILLLFIIFDFIRPFIWQIYAGSLRPPVTFHYFLNIQSTEYQQYLTASGDSLSYTDPFPRRSFRLMLGVSLNLKCVFTWQKQKISFLFFHYTRPMSIVHMHTNQILATLKRKNKVTAPVFSLRQRWDKMFRVVFMSSLYPKYAPLLC